MLSRLSSCGLCAVALFTLTGCGGPTVVEVTGKLVLLPNTKLAEDDSITLIFSSQESGGAGASVTLNKDMTFTAKAKPGKYKIVVAVSAYPGSKDSDKRTASYKKNYDAFLLENTKLTYEVTSESPQNITIDLAQGRAAKN